MKTSWEEAALGQVCNKIQDGAHHSPKKTLPVRKPGTFPYVTSKNIRNWHLDENNVTYVGPEFHDTIYPRCNAEFGDVLLTKDGANTGQVTINTFCEPISLLSSVCLIKPNRSKLDPRFLVYYIQSDAGFENITGQMTGAAIKRIILKNIKASKIPVPPLEEQQRIVAILDEAFEGLDRARAHAEANLKNARELLANAIDSLMATPTIATRWTLGQLCSFENGDRGKNYPGRKSFVPTGVPFINAGHLLNGSIDWANMNYIPKEHFQRLSNGKVRKGDLLFCLRGSLGKFGMVDSDEPGAIASSLVIVRPGDQLLTDYLAAYFESQKCAKMIEHFGNGAAQPNLSAKSLAAFEIDLPDMKDQSSIVESIAENRHSVEALVRTYENRIGSLSHLRQSLLQKAFAGELTAREPA